MAVRRGNDLEIYDDCNPWWSDADPMLKPLRRLAPARTRFLMRMIKPHGAVLDIGCGGGYMVDALSHHTTKLVGIDLAQQALLAADQRARSEKYHCLLSRASADALPFPNHSFDGIVCTDVLVHVPNPEDVVAEISRLLKPGGWLHFSSISRTPLAHLIMITFGETILKMIPLGTHDSQTFIKPKLLNEMLKANGLRVKRMEGIGPVGWRQGGFTFGKHPFKNVMYQGFAVKEVPKLPAP